MNTAELEKVLTAEGQPNFRLKQIKKAIFEEGKSSFSDISTLPKGLQKTLDESLKILSFSVEKVLVSRPARRGGDKKAIKALLETRDGNLLETVLISPKDGLWSACVSSQVGCSLGCAFCATGKMGLKRNLTSEEITDQVLFWRQYLAKNKLKGIFSNIVYMGMGEPFLNFEEVAKSLEDLTNPDLFGFGSRSISVSTSGVMDRLEEFSEKFPQINLAISLHSANPQKRSQLMPINRRYDLDEIRQGLKKYLKNHKRKIFIEYLLIDGVNDSSEDASELAKYLKSTGVWYLLHVNLIRYNFTPSPKCSSNDKSGENVKISKGGKPANNNLVSGETSEKYRPASHEKVREFAQFLKDNDINVTVRRSLGEDIQGACGQLAGKKRDGNKIIF